MTIIRKPYIAPELVTLGDVISVTKQTSENPIHLDAVYTAEQIINGFPNIVTDNQV